MISCLKFVASTSTASHINVCVINAGDKPHICLKSSVRLVSSIYDKHLITCEAFLGYH